jgi:hypothetical protein
MALLRLRHGIIEFVRQILAGLRNVSQSFQNALQAGKGVVAFQGQGESFLRNLFWTGVAGDGGMGLLALLDFSEVRGLVFLLFFTMTSSVADCCPKNLATGKSFSV